MCVCLCLCLCLCLCSAEIACQGGTASNFHDRVLLAGSEKLRRERLVAMRGLARYRGRSDDDDFAVACASIRCSAGARMWFSFRRDFFGLYPPALCIGAQMPVLLVMLVYELALT